MLLVPFADQDMGMIDLAWQNTTVLSGEVIEQVTELKD